MPIIAIAVSNDVIVSIACHGTETTVWVSDYRLFIYFASAAVAVDSSHMTASSSDSWSRFSRPSNFVNRHVWTMWFMVCRWPQSQEGDWARPHLCKLAWRVPWPVRKRFITDHVWRGRLKPGCRIVGSVTIVWLTTEANDQCSLHCVIVSPDEMSDYIAASDIVGCETRVVTQQVFIQEIVGHQRSYLHIAT